MCYLAREIADIFQWIFQKLLEATGNKPPGIIFTDEDPAMNLAIECVLPSAKHRLCAWHLEINSRKKLLAIQEVEKYKLIRSTFWRLKLTFFAVEKFEEQLLFATMSLLLYELNITEDSAFANVRYNNGDHYLTHVVSVRPAVTADFKQRNEANLILPSAESLARVVIPLDCSCSWRANWKLPCRHMFVVACKSSSPIIPAEAFYERWKWNIHTEFDHYSALSTTIYDESNLDEGNVNPEAKRRRSFINLMAYSKFVVSNAVAHGYEKEMLQYLQGFDSIMKAKSKGTSSSNSAQSLSNNPQLITQKRGRKRGSTNISSQREDVNEFIDL